MELKMYRETICGVLAFLSIGAHSYGLEGDKKFQYTLSGGIGTTSIDFGSGGSNSPDEEKYLEDLSSGTTFTGKVRIDYFEYLSVNVEMNYFNSSASFSNALSENISIYTPSIGLLGKYPFKKPGIEIYAGASIGFVIFEDKVEIDGEKVTLSSPQPGYMASSASITSPGSTSGWAWGWFNTGHPSMISIRTMVTMPSWIRTSRSTAGNSGPT